MNRASKVNSFQTPNSVIDEIFPLISSNACKCYMIIVRQTTGWNKDFDKLSLSKLSEKTGLEKRTIQRAMSELESHDLIVRYFSKGQISEYSVQRFTLESSDTHDTSSSDTSDTTQAEVVTPVTPGSDTSVMGVVTQVTISSDTGVTLQKNTITKGTKQRNTFTKDNHHHQRARENETNLNEAKPDSGELFPIKSVATIPIRSETQPFHENRCRKLNLDYVKFVLEQLEKFREHHSTTGAKRTMRDWTKSFTHSCTKQLEALEVEQRKNVSRGASNNLNPDQNHRKSKHEKALESLRGAGLLPEEPGEEESVPESDGRVIDGVCQVA